METSATASFRPGWKNQMKELYLRLDDVAAHVVQQYSVEATALSVLLADAAVISSLSGWLDAMGFRRFRFVSVDAVSGVLLDTVNQQKLRLAVQGSSVSKRIDTSWRVLDSEAFTAESGVLRAEICVPSASRQEAPTGVVPRLSLDALRKLLQEAGGDPKRLPANNAFAHYPEARGYEDLFLLAVEERGLYPQQFAEEMDASQLPPLTAVPFYAHEGRTVTEDAAEKVSA